MSSASLANISRILVLAGGILLVLLSLLILFEFAFTLPFRSPLEDFDILGRRSGIVTLILGVVSIIGSRFPRRLEWAIILILVGYVGGGVGGLLVLIGGILALVSVIVKKT